MKKKRLSRLLSLALVVALVGTMTPSGFSFVRAEEAKVEEQAASEDGIYDEWTQENVVGDDAICVVEDGWLHIKSGVGNGNNPGTNPAMFVNPNEFNFDEAGYFEFTMKTANANTGTTDSDRFGVYLGYNTDQNGMFIGYDNGGWFWQKYQGGNGDWYSGSRKSAPSAGKEVAVRLEWTADKKATLKLDGETVFDQEDFSGIASGLGSKIAIKAGSWKNTVVTDVYLKDIHYTEQTEAATYAVSGTVVDELGNAVEGAAVKFADQETTTDANGSYSFDEVVAGTYTVVVTMAGCEVASKEVVVADQAVTVEEITLVKVADVETEKLSTEDMDVYVSKTFPSVVRYEMKGDLAGKVFYGQSAQISTIRINGTDVVLEKEDVKAEFSANKAVYTMTVKGENIDAVITAELIAEANTLAFNITKVVNNLTDAVDGNPIQTIEIPNHSLISIRSTQEGANLKGALMSSNTTISGDEYVELNGETAAESQDYMYAFISNSELSAGLWSNSENEGSAKAVRVYGGSHNTRVMAVTEAEQDYMKIGLGSTQWYYHRIVTDSKGNNFMVEETEMPKTKIIITGEQNGDGQIDWQDGAVAFRSIMHNPYKSEEVPELVAWRIAMNFGGQAQNPFLTTLDNVKRVAMHTDGLGQSVLLKGYASEGHDSGHPDYADIGKRIGGADDMNTLMEEGAEYGARFGIHVNAGEMYPEAKAFSEELVRRNADGSLRYGWNWIDQGVGIDSVYDLGMGLREARFDALKELVGDNMDFVYVDIWGNRTGGSDDSWQTRKLSKEITDNGWRMTTEWGSANEYDSTFQHWASDLTYGGYALKGENSEVMRFLRNHQKDSWVGDYPTYKGAAMAPLLGGYNMKDFEGWQGRNDYDTYITNLYTHDLTTKFIQHYEIIKWVDGEAFTDTNPDGGTYTWTPEMEITLKDDAGNILVLERGSDDPTEAAYRDRTMTLNGKVVATGAASPGNRTNSQIQNGERKGTETYLLPWFWDAQTGEWVDSEDEKLYHWNTQGGTTTWELPDSWSGLKNVVVYKLTDLGKTEETTVDVVDGKITLTAESEIPYVVFKGEKGNLEITWSEGMHIVDAGFNSGNFDAWEKAGEGNAEIAKSQYSNPMMKLTGEVSMSQTLTDLEAGKQYAVLVGIDNRSDSKATLTISSGDKVLAENYTERSIAKNYVKAYTHSNSSATVDGSSYFQHMYVFFTAPKSGDVVLTLSKMAGEGAAYFDDIRIVENESKNIITNEDGEIVKFVQDFETSVQGIYPFVVSSIEGVEDNRIHLSELHAPYTQAGWDVKKMDDVLEGNWSVKINGLCSNKYTSGGKVYASRYNALAYQTIPQNFRFEPGVTYKISFDYQAGWDDTYSIAIGSEEYGQKNLEYIPLKKSLGETSTVTFTMTGVKSGNSWFGIYSGSEGAVADCTQISSSEGNFGGYKDFVLDNLVIERVEEEYSEETLAALIEEAESYNKDDYAYSSWVEFEEDLLYAKVVLGKDIKTEEEIEDAYKTLKMAIQELKSAPGPEGDTISDIPADQYTVSAGSAQSLSGSEGPVEFAQDGDASTHWHTKWDDTNLDNAWYEFTFTEPTTVDGIRYLPRNGATNANGKILKYNLLVKVEGEEEYRTVIEDGTFSGVTEWQVAKFDAVDNVTHVKLVPTETAGTSDTQVNRFASAAELRVTTPVEIVETVDKTILQEAIAAVELLDETDYTKESWSHLKEKLSEAEAVMAKEDATAYEVALAATNLIEAIHALELDETQEPSEVDKSVLDKLYRECVAYYKEANHSEANWKSYQDALAAAKAVLDDPDATQEEVDKALKDLAEIVKVMNKELEDDSKAPGTDKEDNKQVATGDHNSVLPWILVAFVAVVVFAISFMKRRREHR